MELEGKVAIITGAASGIGEVTAGLLAKEGARVAIVDINRDKGMKIAHKISQEGQDATFIYADVSNPQDAENAIKGTIDHYGKLDILFNNAGVELLSGIVNTRVEDLNKVIDVNLKGTFLASKYAIPELKKQYGVILNNASGAGLIGWPNEGAYSASKGGIVSLTKSMAAELAPYIRVNCICPGYIKTPMHDRAEGSIETFDEEVIPRIVPLRRIGKPEEVAYAALFLVSDKAAYITGAVLPIDGGLSSIRIREV